MRKFLCTSFAFVLAVIASAQWMPNPATNNPIVTTSSSTAKSGLVSASDGAGGMFIAWIDSRIASSQSIYVQRILSNGTKGFASEVEVTGIGNVAGGTSVSKSNLYIIADGTGGVICVWQDSRNTTVTPANSNNDIYGQRINSAGTALWTAGGKRLTVSDNSVSAKTIPVVELVNATEAIIVYGDNRLSTVDLFAQKVLISDGSTVWANEVALHGNLTGTQNNHAVLADGAGGLFLVFQDPRNGTSNIDIYAQRVDNAGALQWGASGTAVATGANNQLTPQLVSDGAGGIVTVWSDARTSTTDANIYAQKLNSSGVVQWTAGGELINNSANLQTHPLIINSGVNYIISWNDNRTASTGDRNIYVQSVNGSGTLQWTPSGGTALEGIAIVTATGNQPGNAGTMQLVNDGLGNAVLIWEDARIGSSSLDVYAQKINTSGVVQWQANGIQVATAANSQSAPVAALSSSNSIIVAWRDSRTAANGEIYASRIESSGVLPVTLTNFTAAPFNRGAMVKWSGVNEYDLDYYEIEHDPETGVFNKAGKVAANNLGAAEYSFLLSELPAGKHSFRLKIYGKDGRFTYSAVRTISIRSSVVSLYPNPAREKIIVEAKGVNIARAVITTLSGSILMSMNLNSTRSTIDISKLPAGSYILKVTGTGENESVLFVKS